MSYIFVALDGKFLKARFVQTLVLAVGIVANGHNIPWTWGVVESENTDTWNWFLTCLREYLEKEGSTIISDRNHALLRASDDVFQEDDILRVICCIHLKRNFIENGHGVHVCLFWQLTHSRTITAYHGAVAELRDRSLSAADYLPKIDLLLFVMALFLPGSSFFGHKTSKVVESVNRKLWHDREISILDMLDSIWMYMMLKCELSVGEARTLLRQVPARWYTPWAEQQLQKSKDFADGYTVNPQNKQEAWVHWYNGRLLTVNLQERTCDCKHFSEKNDILGGWHTL